MQISINKFTQYTHTQMHARIVFTQHYRQDAVISSLKTQGKRSPKTHTPTHTHVLSNPSQKLSMISWVVLFLHDFTTNFLSKMYKNVYYCWSIFIYGLTSCRFLKPDWADKSGGELGLAVISLSHLFIGVLQSDWLQALQLTEITQSDVCGSMHTCITGYDPYLPFQPSHYTQYNYVSIFIQCFMQKVKKDNLSENN